MKKIIPVLIILGLLLGACSLLPQGTGSQDLSDEEMATRVAELLSTMTTPTEEIVFPPTPTAGLPTVNLPTVQPTESTPVVVTTVPAVIATITPSETTPEAETTQSAEPTATAEPTGTAIPGDPINSLGAPSGTDSMDSYQKWAWPTDSDSFLKVEFKDGFLQMTGLSTLAGWRLPLIAQQTNTYIELTANSGACEGKDSYGIIFRVPVFKEPDQGYLYEATCDGYVRLWKWDGKVKPNGLAQSLIGWKQSPDLKTGANQSNRLGVMVVGKNIKVYVNGVLQGEATDSAFAAGFFGVFVRSVSTNDYTVKFDEMKFWENPGQ